jgi:hypothetical protein
MVDLEMRTWYGAPCYFVLGAVHAIAFWLTVSFLTPFILLVALFNDRRRLLHDLLVGTIVINNEGRGERSCAARADPFDGDTRASDAIAEFSATGFGLAP